ncbi:TRAP-type C4-dicarboxylate transport system permease small subunit [Amorphus suaedae]
MSAVARALRVLATLLHGIGAYLLLPALVCLVTLDVVLRYVFNAPLIGGLEGAQYLLLLFFVCGMLESFRTGAHIRADILAGVLPPAAKRAVALVMCASLVLVFGLLAKKAVDEIPFLYSLPQMTPELHLRVWVFYAVIAVIAVLVALYAVVAATEIVRGRRAEVAEEGEGEWG